MSQLTVHSQLEMSEDDRGGFSWEEEMLETVRYTAALMATLRTKWFVAQPYKCKSNETEVTSCLFTLPRCHRMNRAEKRGSLLSTLVNDLDFNIIASVPCVASFEHIRKVVCITSFGLPNKLSTSNAWTYRLWMPWAELKKKKMMSYNYPQITAHMNGQPEVKEGLLKKKKYYKLKEAEKKRIRKISISTALLFSLIIALP